MSSNTPNYNLIKPDPSDFYNIADFNTNADTIDTALVQKLDSSAFKTTLDSYKATTTQAQNGTNDDTYMTPQKTLSAITTNGVARLGTILTGSNLNTYNSAGVYQVRLDDTSGITNFPSGAYGYGNLTVLSGNPTNSNVVTQIYTPHIVGGIYIRVFTASTWRAWERMASFQHTGILSDLLTTNKTNLVAAINEVKSQSLASSSKSSTAQAQAGSDDSTYMTPLKVIQALSVFGLGGNSAKPVLSGSYNDINVGGIYSISPAVTGGPNASASTLFHLPNASGSAIQIDITNSTNLVNVRSMVVGNWSVWDTVSSSGLTGALSALTTTDKSNLVSAINEVKSTSLNVDSKANSSQAQDGTDDTLYMTPLKTKQQLDYYASTRKGTIPPTGNLNTIFSPGMYTIATDTLPINMPIGAVGYGVLVVSKGTLVDNASMTSQVYIGHSATSAMFYRSASGSTWREWVKVSTSAEVGLLSSLQTSDKTSIVNAINSAYNDTLKLNAKASTSQAQTGTNDDTYMTPLKTKQHLDYAVSAIKATEAQAKAGTSNDALMTPLRVNNVTGTLTNLQTTDKSSLVAAINENFTRVVNGKGLIATAINDMGGSASGSDSFQELSDDIREIVPKYASGTIAVSTPLTPYSYYDASGTESMPSVIVSGLTFQPSRIVIIGTGGISRITEYDFELGTLSESIRCSAYTGNRRDSGATYHFKNTGNAYVTDTGFKLPIISGSDNATWHAYE